MTEQQQAWPRGRVAYPVSLGDSLRGGGSGGGGSGGGDAYTSFKYDWKVGGGDSAKQGRVKRDRDGNKVTVQFQNVVEGEKAVRYQVRRVDGFRRARRREKKRDTPIIDPVAFVDDARSPQPLPSGHTRSPHRTCS